MTLSLSEVDHIADLARLQLTLAERARFREQLEAILNYAAALQEVDVSDVSPTSTVLPLHTVLRADELEPSLSVEEALANAPDRVDDRFRVLPVLG